MTYSYMFLESGREALNGLKGFVEDGKLRAVVGRTVRLDDVDGVRDACGQVYEGRGGIGKTVIEVAGK